MTPPDAAPERATTDDPAARRRDDAIAELAALTLPFMWSLRQQAMRVFEPLGLRPTRVLLLELVARGIDRPGTLAEVLDTVPPAVTAMLNELVGKGLLVRATDPIDRRRARLRLTPDGEAFLDTSRERWIAASRERLRGIDDGELTALLRSLRALVAEESA